MAFDEVIAGELTLVGSYLTNYLNRLKAALNLSRTNAYTIDALWEDVRAQFVENWDTWNQMMGLPTDSVLPSAIIRGTWNNLNTMSATARVNRRLTNAVYERTPLGRFGGGAAIGRDDYSVAPAGDFEGYVQVTLNVNATQPAGNRPEVYRGMVLVKQQGDVEFQALAWVVVVVDP